MQIPLSAQHYAKGMSHTYGNANFGYIILFDPNSENICGYEFIQTMQDNLVDQRHPIKVESIEETDDIPSHLISSEVPKPIPKVCPTFT